MKVIYNRYIPFGSFAAINLFGVIFAKNRYTLGKCDLNHEYIHTLQQREMLFIFFYLWYIIEWLILFLQTRSIQRAYFLISFEQEAYDRMYDLDYRHKRQPYAWHHFLQFKNKKNYL